MMGTEKRRVFAAHPAERKHTILLDFLEQEQISKELRDGIEEYRKTYPTPPELRSRVPRPRYHYYGKEVWEAAVAAILCGENLLLAGSKATGKNVLAENLAQVFARPGWDVSFHVNMDAAGLIGMDTFENGQVTFRPGPIYLCARYGGFGVLDEINMAKNEALAVLHAALDFLTEEFPTLEKKYREQFVQLFLDLQKKCENAEISSKALDLRGMLDALRLIRDVIAARIPEKLDRTRLFSD